MTPDPPARRLRAVVTGAGRGIGESVAVRLHRDGYRVACVDVDGAAATRTAASVDGTAHECDVSVRADVMALADEIGAVTVLVNNAGTWHRSSILDLDERNERVWAVNVHGTLWGIQAFAPSMVRAGSGAIVNISSTNAEARPVNSGVYSASKVAVEALTAVAAAELGSSGVRVNAVAPGTIPTPGSKSNYDDEDRRSWRLRQIPLGHFGSPDDIARSVSFLVSSRAGYVTGQLLRVDGGLTATRQIDPIAP